MRTDADHSRMWQNWSPLTPLYLPSNWDRQIRCSTHLSLLLSAPVSSICTFFFPLPLADELAAPESSSTVGPPSELRVERRGFKC